MYFKEMTDHYYRKPQYNVVTLSMVVAQPLRYLIGHKFVL